MTSIVITGANGFIGRLLAARLAAGNSTVVNGREVSVEKLVQVDKFVPAEPKGGDEWVEGDVGDLVAERPEIFTGADLVIHLASAVSGECEADLDLGTHGNPLDVVAKQVGEESVALVSTVVADFLAEKARGDSELEPFGPGVHLHSAVPFSASSALRAGGSSAGSGAAVSRCSSPPSRR